MSCRWCCCSLTSKKRARLLRWHSDAHTISYERCVCDLFLSVLNQQWAWFSISRRSLLLHSDTLTHSHLLVHLAVECLCVWAKIASHHSTFMFTLHGWFWLSIYRSLAHIICLGPCERSSSCLQNPNICTVHTDLFLFIYSTPSDFHLFSNRYFPIANWEIKIENERCSFDRFFLSFLDSFFLTASNLPSSSEVRVDIELLRFIVNRKPFNYSRQWVARGGQTFLRLNWTPPVEWETGEIWVNCGYMLVFIAIIIKRTSRKVRFLFFKTIRLLYRTI